MSFAEVAPGKCYDEYKNFGKKDSEPPFGIEGDMYVLFCRLVDWPLANERALASYSPSTCSHSFKLFSQFNLQFHYTT
jgi:hypothetical protein